MKEKDEDFKEQLIKTLIYGYLIIVVVWCISGSIMVSSMWNSYFNTEYGYMETPEIKNINTNTFD